jgi:hypothetical protein
MPDYLQHDYILTDEQKVLQKKRTEKYTEQVKTYTYT